MEAPDVIADRLHSGAIRLLRRVRVEDAATGVTPAQLSALSVLVFGGPRTMSQLAAAEQVRLPTVSRLVSTLEAAGLATRSRSAADARSVVVEATPRGRALLQEGRRRRVERLARDVAALAEGERETLARASAILARLGG